MPMNNTLNVSELLKRLGVVGDSKGSAPILEELRLSINLADLSDLVPPLPVPIGGATDLATSGVGTVNHWTLNARSPGGLQVFNMQMDGNDLFTIWITDDDPFAGAIPLSTVQLAFNQPVQSVMFHIPASAAIAPAASLFVRGPMLGNLIERTNYLGPGQHFNIESLSPNTTNEMISVVWTEYPGLINI